MKKQLALVAVASAFASTIPIQAADFQVGAATNVSISGLLAVGVKQSEVTNTVRPGMTSEWRLDDNTSRLIISSTSKIADGWAVIFRMESRFQADVRPSTALYQPYSFGSGNYYPTGAATGLADGDTYGGIMSPYGTITFGKSTLYYTDTIAMDYLGLAGAGEAYRIWDANGLATFNLLSAAPVIKNGANTSVNTTGNTRSQNVLKYNAPRFGKLDLSVAISKNAASDELHYGTVAQGTVNAYSFSNGGTLYAKANYADGPLVASLSYLSQKINGGGFAAPSQGPNNTTAYRLGVGYMLPFGLKVGVVYDNTAIDHGIASNVVGNIYDTKSERNCFEIPISYMTGNHGFYATYTKAGNAASDRPDTGATQINLVYDYALTKRAFIGISYAAIKNDAKAHYVPFLSNTTLGPSANATGENWRNIGLNFNYWF